MLCVATLRRHANRKVARLLWWEICPLFTMTRKFIHTILSVVAIGFFSSLVAADHESLRGTWQLDAAASNFSGAAASNFSGTPPPQSGVLAISNNPHKILHIAEFLKDADKERTVEMDWKLENRYHPVDGDGFGEVLARWDGSVLVGTRLTQAGMEETRFQLAPGGQTLTESIQSGTNITTLVWKRQ